MRIFILVLLFFVWGCAKKKSVCRLSPELLLNSEGNKVYVAALYPDKHVLGISDSNSVKKAKGGAYYFYENGGLESYKFFQSENTYVYSEDYDEQGNLLNGKGKILVDKKIREVNRDSAIIRVYFFSLFKSLKNLNVKLNNNPEMLLAVSKDTIYSNMKTASLAINTNGLRFINLFFSGEYTDLCTSSNRVFFDTLNLIKNPMLNFAPVNH